MVGQVVILAGGVGGSRLAQGFEDLDSVQTTVVVNVGDDAVVHGLAVSPDLDTVVYTLAGVQGPEGWGRSADTWAANDELGRFGLDNSFRLGDRDLALNLFRTGRLAEGAPLSTVTAEIANAFGVRSRILPSSNDLIRTQVLCDEWIDFMTYFVSRGHRDTVEAVRFAGIEAARPAPGVVDAIEASDAVVIAPSNPVLSIWPIVRIPDLREAIEQVPRRLAVSPFIGGLALKGPAADVLSSLGYPPGSKGVVAAYDGLITDLVVDISDAGDSVEGIRLQSSDIRISERSAATRLAKEIIEWLE